MIERSAGHRGGHRDARAVPQPMGKQQDRDATCSCRPALGSPSSEVSGASRVSARPPDRAIARRVGRFPIGRRARPRRVRPATVASGNWKTVSDACRSRSSRPSSSGLNFEFGENLPAVRQMASQANRIALRLAFLVLGLGQAELEGMRPRLQRLVAQVAARRPRTRRRSPSSPS